MPQRNPLTSSSIAAVLILAAALLSGCSCDVQPSEDSESTASQASDATVLEPSDNEEVQGRGEGKDQWWHALPRASWQAFDEVTHDQPWFEVYEVGDEVLAIYEPGQFEEVISYLILGSERALLFDTGLGIGDMRGLVDQLTDLEVVVINSHSHYDHVGGNHGFDTILSPDTEYTRGHAAGRTHDEVAEFVGPGWIWKDTPQGFSPETFSSHSFEISRFLSDGEVIDLGDRSIEVLLTPGHAPDALCLLDRQYGLLFTGDTFYLAPLYTHLEGSDFDDYLATTRRLAALAPEVESVMPAHNETRLSSDYLPRLQAAFEAVDGGKEPNALSDGLKQYDFGEFSVMTR